ncbi:phosphatase PAP2 family protein [Thermosulfurimonas dismutans]|uniref:Phosphoesterase, PA-phosphatase related n=1 Tax=Thermosulfurimonas dismutans TaxID=999894 RepID=A0A179D6S0_9BACT|nr:phosphatase PAP2 family protein [Thermosulfurimonas dismutans]OAQ21439.1 Phosphoesterase, PA-phosphatase related [Thermosulfurimonas dismutans]
MTHLFFLINSGWGPFWDRLMVLLSREDVIYAFFVTMSAILIKRLGNRGLLAPILAFVLVIGADFLCARGLKPLIARPRPYANTTGIRVYKGGRFFRVEKPIPARSFGFPSCHAINTATAAGFFSAVDPVLAPAVIVFSFMVGLSRVYLGHHWPEDVLFGWFLGGLIGFVGGLIWRRRIRDP